MKKINEIISSGLIIYIFSIISVVFGICLRALCFNNSSLLSFIFVCLYVSILEFFCDWWDKNEKDI